MLEPSTLKSPLKPNCLPVFFASSSLFPDLPTFQQASRTLTFDQARLTTDLQPPSGNTQVTSAIAQLPPDFSNSLNREIVTSGLTASSGDQTDSVQSAQDIVVSISRLVKEISGTVPFADGTIDVDLSTSAGAVQGSIEFGNGALVSNLTTPFGSYFSSIDFKSSDQYPFNFNGTPGIVNLDDGLVILDFQPEIQDDEIAIPINALSGNVTFNDGQAILNIPTPFGAFATNFDLSALVKPSTLQVSGTVTVQDGTPPIEMTGDFGIIQTTLDVPKLVQNAGSIFATVEGMIQMTNDAIVYDFKTSIS